MLATAGIPYDVAGAAYDVGGEAYDVGRWPHMLGEEYRHVAVGAA